MSKIAGVAMALCVYINCYAQKPDSIVDYAAELARLEAELDSASIFSLFDSILSSISIQTSEINVRLSYTSNVANAGRDFGFNQFGFTPGISYYHKAGWYADFSGFWNSEFDPNYSLSLISVGKLGIINNSLSYSANYEKWLYHYDINNDISTPIPTNSINANLNYEYKPFNIGIDYSFLFGKTEAHRITGTLSGRWNVLNKKDKLKISLLPTFSIVYGNQTVIQQFSGNLIDELRSNVYLRKNLQSDDFRMFLRSIEFSDEERQLISNVIFNQELTQEQKTRLLALIYLSNPQVQDYVYDILQKESDVYGIMNYSFSFPFTFSYKKWLAMISYSYSVPVKLPNEIIELDPVHLFNATLIYRIPLN